MIGQLVDIQGHMCIVQMALKMALSNVHTNVCEIWQKVNAIIAVIGDEINF